jgi:hypothetical protein
MSFTRKQAERKLVKPGWAGDLSQDEVDFIQRELERRPSLRRKWGYIGAILKGVPLPSFIIRRIAKHGLR